MTTEMIKVKAIIYTEITRAEKDIEFYESMGHIHRLNADLSSRCEEERNAAYWRREELMHVLAELKEEGIEI